MVDHTIVKYANLVIGTYRLQTGLSAVKVTKRRWPRAKSYQPDFRLTVRGSRTALTLAKQHWLVFLNQLFRFQHQVAHRPVAFNL